MIAVHQEPKGLKPDAIPLGDFRTRGSFISNAEKGSRRLRDAIVRAEQKKAPPKPKVKRGSKIRLRSWKARQLARIEVLRVQQIAATHFRIKVSDLTGPRGKRKLAWQRQVAMFVAREATPASYPDIGLCFGARDHTTVLHAYRLIGSDPAAERHVRAINKALSR